MRCLLKSVVTGKTSEMELSDALEPAYYPEELSTDFAKRIIGRLAALLVEKGVASVDEMREVCGIQDDIIFPIPQEEA